MGKTEPQAIDDILGKVLDDAFQMGQSHFPDDYENLKSGMTKKAKQAVLSLLPEKIHEAQDPRYAAKATEYWNRGYNRALTDMKERML